MKVTINGAEKEITFSKVYTRAIDRGYNEIILEWVKANTAQIQAWSVDVEISKVQKANDFLIVSMTNLTQDELDGMNMEDYSKVLKEVEKIKIPSAK